MASKDDVLSRAQMGEDALSKSLLSSSCEVLKALSTWEFLLAIMEQGGRPQTLSKTLFLSFTFWDDENPRMSLSYTPVLLF
jgi:hypothetical protein